jgi:hypothetical protein
MTRGERRAIERLVAASVPDGDGLPPVASTDAVDAFATWLRAAPRLNRVLLRGLLRAVTRGDLAGRVERGRGPLGGAAQFLARVAAHCYYGDDAVSRALGYDAGEVAARGLALRRAEGRL